MGLKNIGVSGSGVGILDARNIDITEQKGIQCLITKDELRQLWFRDKAYLLKVPSIDRIRNSDNYTFDNCRFIENIDNIRRKRKNNSTR